MVVLDNLVVNVALPSIHRELGASIQALEWTVNAYVLAYAVLLLTGAALGDRFGRKRWFMTGIALFTVSSAAAALSPTIGLLIAARAAQGVGAAIATPLTLTLLAEAFPPQQRGLALGVWSGISGIAVALGPLVGGAVVQLSSWHWIFWLNVPIGAAALALSRARLAESHGSPARLDLPALVLLTGGASALVWGLVRASADGWGAAGTVGGLGGGALLIAGFVAWEKRAAAPMLPLRLFGARDFAAANATALLMMGSLSAAVFLIAQYCQLVLGYSPLVTGLRILPWTATPLLIAPVAGRVSDRIGRRPILSAGMGLQAAGLGWFAMIAGTAPRYQALVAPLLVAGIGISMALPTVATAAMSAVRPDQLGKASGANSTLQRLGGVFGVAVATTVFTAGGRLGTAAQFTAGFRPALAVAAGLSLLGMLTALALRRRPRLPEVTRGSVPPVTDTALVSR
jgi:EmrB/QacA subfamily drug resistance transporter